MEAPELIMVKKGIEARDGEKFLRFLSSFADLGDSFKIVKNNNWEELAMGKFIERFSAEEETKYMFSLVVKKARLERYGGGAYILIDDRVSMGFYIDAHSKCVIAGAGADEAQKNGEVFIDKAKELIKLFDPDYIYVDLGVRTALNKENGMPNDLPWLVYAKSREDLIILLEAIKKKDLEEQKAIEALRQNNIMLEAKDAAVFVRFDKTMDDRTNREKILQCLN